jgi:hypothetical protein
LSHASDPQECKAQGILDAKVWDTGLAVITKNLQIYTIVDIEAPFTIKLKSPGTNLCFLYILLFYARSLFSFRIFVFLLH